MPSSAELSKKRDELNNSVREKIQSVRKKTNDLKSLNESAKKLREERDKKNKLVVELKKNRDSVNTEVKKIAGQLRKLDDEIKKLPVQTESTEGLKKKAKDLDWKIQTEHRSVKKDEELRDSLDKMEFVINATDEKASIFEKRAKLSDEIEKKRIDAETIHSIVVDNSQAAQELHNQVVSLYGKIKAIREEISPVLKELDELRMQANEVHGELIALRKNTRESVKAKYVSKKGAQEKELKSRAKELMDGFSAGKKLSTEELMIIRVYG